MQTLLLQVPDGRILSELKSREQCGDRLLTDVSSWLTKQREARNEGQWAPARSKAFADQVITQMREDLALAIRETVRRERIQPEDLAKRCGTSREAVASLLAGSTPSSLELSLRMAGAIGIDVEFRVRTRHASLATKAMAERTCALQSRSATG
jgi:transcriptional regulator with XRE-family HTH domain